MRPQLTALRRVGSSPLGGFGRTSGVHRRCYRSGTTWLFDILTSHPQVAGVSESFLFLTPGLGSLLGPMHSSLEGVGVGRLLSGEELLAEVRTFSVRLLGRALGPGHRFIVERSAPPGAALSSATSSPKPGSSISSATDVTACVSVLAATALWAPGWKKSFGADLEHAALEGGPTWTRPTSVGICSAPGVCLDLLRGHPL